PVPLATSQRDRRAPCTRAAGQPLQPVQHLLMVPSLGETPQFGEKRRFVRERRHHGAVLTSSPGDRVLRERQDVGVEFLQLLELDRADAEPERVRKITTPDAEFRLDRRVRRVDYAIPVEIVVGVLVLHFQARGTVGVELQPTWLKVELEALRVDYRDRDENRIVRPKRRAVR